jgi:hypothetical protein
MQKGDRTNVAQTRMRTGEKKTVARRKRIQLNGEASIVRMEPVQTTDRATVARRK